MGTDKKNLTIHNCTDNDIEIMLQDDEKSLKINSNSTAEVLVYSDSISLTVSEYAEGGSEKLKFSEAVLGAVVSVPLFVLDCINFETVDKSIKLPVKFSWQILEDSNEIFIKDTARTFHMCGLTLNGKTVWGEVVYRHDEIECQIRKYYKSFLVSMILPIIIFMALIIVSVYLKSFILAAVTVIVFHIFAVCISRIYKKDQKIIKSIYERIE